MATQPRRCAILVIHNPKDYRQALVLVSNPRRVTSAHRALEVLPEDPWDKIEASYLALLRAHAADPARVRKLVRSYLALYAQREVAGETLAADKHDWSARC